MRTVISLIALATLLGCTNAHDHAEDQIPEYMLREVDLSPDNPGSVTYTIRDYRDLDHIFDSLDYETEDIFGDLDKVPRMYTIKITERWADSTVKEIDVQTKKGLFVQVLLPLALSSNELISQDREGLISLQQRPWISLKKEELDWLEREAVYYRAIKEGEEIDSMVYGKLLPRMDVIPVSLVLSQTALESGWGTSRFTSEGNSLFGQMAWGKNVMAPAGQDEKHGNRGLKKYGTLIESVHSYMHNLNSHYAYEDFRKQRAAMRDSMQDLDAKLLAESLVKYSTRGEEYVEHVLSMMRSNNFAKYDNVLLDDGGEVYLLPVLD